MPELNAATWIMVIAVSVFTAAAAFTDIRSKRITNKLTLPMFFAGWVYQIVMSFMYGWGHLGSALGGFLVGFGLLFVLWVIGGGGGGDVKLMGALSVWLGFQLTLYVLFVSTVIVLLATTTVVLWSMSRKGIRNTRDKYVSKGITKVGKPGLETSQDKVGRRVMAYAAPVAIATWIVLFWHVTGLEKATASQPDQAAPTVQETAQQNPVQQNPVEQEPASQEPVIGDVP